jgi:Flp pilus assembly pilin Flp
MQPNSLRTKLIQQRFSRGQTLVEYALILAFISVVAIASLLSMGGQVSSVYTTINRQLVTSTEGGATTPAHGH